MAIQKWNSLTAMFFAQADFFAKDPFLYTKAEDTWQAMSWSETAQKILKLATAMRTLGVQKGDRVILVSENRSEWLIADLAIMALGAISVPTYTTYTSRDYLYLIENSGAHIAIVSSRTLARTFLKAAHEVNEMEDAICIEDPGIEQILNVKIHDWHHLMDVEPDTRNLRADINTAKRDDIACLIYTSGTGGAPKGVMLHHGSILSNCEGAAKVVEPLGLKNNRFLSFLPLSHAYEHTAGQFLPIAIGASIWYCEGLEKLAANMEETAPTLMVVVPRLFEMLRTRLVRQIKNDGGLKAKLFDQTIALGTKALLNPENMTFLDKIKNVFLSFTVRRGVDKKFGGALKALVSGGAPLAPDVGFFFKGLGLPLLQGYGQTESGPVISVNPPHAPRMHTVGKILDDVDVRIADDGEILVRGELVMKGYWHNARSTAETIKEGWLHTGDIGLLDDDGYLEITDRKKDIIVNDKGENISPQRIEGLLSLEDEIAQAMIYGDQRPHLVGLIVPDQEWMIEWAREHSKKSVKLAELRPDPDFHKALGEAVSRINKRLSNFEKVRKFTIATEAFSVENEQMTPTLKVRRHKVHEIYGEDLIGLY